MLYDNRGQPIRRCEDCTHLIPNQEVKQSNKDARFLCDHCWNKEQYEWEQDRLRGYRK